MYQTIKKIQEKVFLVEKDNILFIKKTRSTKRENSKILSILIKISGLDKIHFKKEVTVLRYLSRCPFKYFRFPKLIETDGSSYIILEYINGELKLGHKVAELDLIKALVEMQTSTYSNPFSLKRSLLDYYVSPIMNLTRASFTVLPKYLGIYEILKIYIFYLMAVFTTEKINHSLLFHSDLRMNNNVITNKSKEIYFIDFGSVRLEKRFLLGDIMGLFFEIDTLSIDGSIVNKYISHLREHGIVDCHFKIKQHTWVSLLFIIINRLRDNRQCTTIVRFIRMILLDKKGFSKWCDDNKISFS